MTVIMKVLSERKGITPVIAIVLLLVVTVSAVGVVWTQFENIVDQGSTQASYLESVDVKVTVVQRNSSTSPDQMAVVFENTGPDEYNLTDISRLEYQMPGESSIRAIPGSDVFGEFDYNSADKTCFSALENFAPGDIESCNTGVEMPSPGSPLTINLVKSAGEGTSVIDEYTCEPSTSSSTTC